MANLQSDSNRREHRVVGGVLLGLLVLLAGSVHAQAPATEAVVQTDKGAVRGTVKATYTEWLGIPFAAPPVGPLRWNYSNAEAMLATDCSFEWVLPGFVEVFEQASDPSRWTEKKRQMRLVDCSLASVLERIKDWPDREPEDINADWEGKWR